MCGSGDTDTAAEADWSLFACGTREPELTIGQEVFSVERAVDVECLGQTPGPPAEVAHRIGSAAALHQLDAFKWLNGTNQDGGAFTACFARYVETKVRAVDQIDIRMKRLEKHRCVARPWADKRVRCRIADDICFSFDDTSGDAPVYTIADEHYSYQHTRQLFGFGRELRSVDPLELHAAF